MAGENLENHENHEKQKRYESRENDQNHDQNDKNESHGETETIRPLSLPGLLKGWLASRIPAFFLCALTVLTMAILSALHQASLAPLRDSLIPILFFAACFGGWDFYRYARRYQAIRETLANRNLTMEYLPDPAGPAEALYQDMLRAFLREREELLSGVQRQQAELSDYYTLWAHQMKTPIAAMRLLLQDSEDPAGQSKNRFRLEQELFRIERYTEMVLHFLRIESMSADLVLRKVSLDAVVRRAVKKYSVSFIGGKLSLDVQPIGVTVVTDEKWISLVIEQILSNCIKYTRPGGRITIRMDQSSPETLVIADTGIGIAPEDLPRIFEKGFTGFNGRMDRKSTGIGLYLCKRVTRRLGHGLRAHSQIGEGATFLLDFARRPVNHI